MKDSNVKQSLIEAAVQLFADKGFAGTATKDIARLAEVNETSLFRIFGTKEDLFWAALKSCLDRIWLSKELREALVDDADPEVALPLIIEFVVQAATRHQKLVRLLTTSLLELRPQAEVVNRQAIAPIFNLVVEYLARGIQRGVLRPLDPELTAISMGATVLGQEGLSEVLTGVSRPYVNTDEAVLAYSNYWLKTLMPLEVPSSGMRPYPHARAARTVGC